MHGLVAPYHVTHILHDAGRDFQRLARGEIRIISSRRARVLRRRGVTVYWSTTLWSQYWQPPDGTASKHVRRFRVRMAAAQAAMQSRIETMASRVFYGETDQPL